MNAHPRLVTSVLAALVVLLTAVPSMADILGGTTWNVPLTLNAKAKGVGSYVVSEVYTVAFETDGTFRATASDDGNFFAGTYTIAPNGKLNADLDDAQLQTFIKNEIVNSAAQSGVVVTDVWVGNLAVKDSSMAKNNQGSVTYTLKTKIGFDLTAKVNGVSQATSGSIMLGGRSTQTVAAADELFGTAFNLDIVEKISASGLGSVQDSWFMLLYFGPNSTLVPALQPGEFMLESGDAQVRGTYTRSGNRGKIDLQIAPSVLTEDLESALAEAAADYPEIEDLTVTLLNQKFYGGYKKGIFSLNAQVVCSFSALVDGVEKSGTVKYNLKGAGPLME